MPTLPKAGVEIVADKSAWDSSYKDIISDAGKLDSLAPTVKVSVDAADIDTTRASLLDLERDAMVKVNVQDNEVDNTVKKVNDIDSETPDVKVTAEDSELDAVKEKLDQIRNLAIINIVMSFDQSQIEGLPIIGTLIEIDNLTKQIAGRTGQEIPGAAGIINSLYVQAWGDSKEQIADLIIELDRAGVVSSDLEQAATDVFEAAAVSGEDPIEIFRRMDTLVKNGLVPSLGDAADFIAGGFQAGLGRGADFLDTIDEYTQVLADAGLSADGFFKILDAGQDAGVRNTDKLADAYKEMFNLVREETGRFNEFGETTDRTQALDRMGLMDEAEAYSQGKITGDEFAAGLLDGLREIEDPEEQRVRALAIFGPTMVEDVGLPGLLAADLNSTKGDDAWQGAADSGAAIINETIGTAITELQRTIETELATTLDETFDLTSRLDTARQQFQTFVDELQSGKGIGEAIEIGFNMPGFADSVSRFEAGVGNFLISILELVAGVQEFLGKDSSATRAEIARREGEQLAFDLKVANINEIPGELQTAIDRGLDTGAIADATGTALSELIASGEFQKAQTLIDSLNELKGGAPMVAPGLSGVQITEAQVALRDGSIERIQEQIDKGNLIAPVTVDTTQFQAQLDAARHEFTSTVTGDIAEFQPTGFWDALLPTGVGTSFQAQLDALEAGFSEIEPPSDFWSAIIPPEELDITGRGEKIKGDLEPAQKAFTDLQTTAETALPAVATVAETSITDTINQLNALDQNVTTLDDSVLEHLTGNTVTTSFQTVASVARVTMADVIAAVSSVFPVIAQLDTALKQIAATATAVQQTAMTAISTAGAAASTVNNTTINVNQNNTINGGAQSAANGYELAAQVRGMG